MIKRILVITALISIAFTMIWLGWNPTYVLPFTILGIAVAITPLAALTFALFALMITLFISMFMFPC